MSRLPAENLKKKCFIFFELLPFANLDTENLISFSYIVSHDKFRIDLYNKGHRLVFPKITVFFLCRQLLCWLTVQTLMKCHIFVAFHQGLHCLW